jgi:hypothetical protein
VRLAYQFAIESDLVRAEGIEATEFPDLAERFRVFAVPRTIINDGDYVEGALGGGVFLDAILKTLEDSR